MLIERIAAPLAGAWVRLKEAGGVGRGSAAELTEEELRWELADLRLLGQAFGPEEYRRALEVRLGVEISIEEVEGTLLRDSAGVRELPARRSSSSGWLRPSAQTCG